MKSFGVAPTCAALLVILAACAPRARPAALESQPFAPQGEPLTTVSYRCDSGKHARASYHASLHADPHAEGVQLEYGGETYLLARVVSASGARYADETADETANDALVWWTKGDEAFVSHPVTGVIYDTCREVDPQGGAGET